MNAESFLNDWPDGTAKSFGNGFTEHMDGAQSQFASDRAFRSNSVNNKSAGRVATESRERVEASGRNIGTIVGLSRKSDLAQADATRYHVTQTTQ